MNSRFPLRWQVYLAAMLHLCLVDSEAEAQGSPNTRLIGLGINYFVAAPVTPGQLYELDKQTGAATPLGSPFLIEPEHIGANLSANSADGLFNVDGGTGGRVNRLNLSGQVVDFAPLSDGSSFPPHVGAVAFDSQDRLFAATVNGSPVIDAPALLSRIDTATGMATPGPIIGELLLSMAFDASDSLYAVANNVGLIQIDAATGQWTTIGGDLAAPPSSLFSPKPIVFDDDGTLFAVTDRLLVVDPANGSTTPVGGVLGNYTIVGLAIIAIPEPSGIALWALVGVAAIVGRRRGLAPSRPGRPHCSPTHLEAVNSDGAKCSDRSN